MGLQLRLRPTKCIVRYGERALRVWVGRDAEGREVHALLALIGYPAPEVLPEGWEAAAGVEPEPDLGGNAAVAVAFRAWVAAAENSLALRSEVQRVGLPGGPAEWRAAGLYTAVAGPWTPGFEPIPSDNLGAIAYPVRNVKGHVVALCNTADSAWLVAGSPSDGEALQLVADMLRQIGPMPATWRHHDDEAQQIVQWVRRAQALFDSLA